jgi:hypothetical protein
MKKLLILSSILFVFFGYSETYKVQIIDTAKGLGKSIVIKSTTKDFNLSCIEGVLDEDNRVCKVVNSITRVEECPNGYTNLGNGNCESSITESKINYCARGSNNGSSCSVSNVYSLPYRCPSGYYDRSGTCYSFAGSYVDFNNPCTSGYVGSSNRCFPASSATSKFYGCYGSDTQSGSTCYGTTTESYVYGCRSGFTDIGGQCKRTLTTPVSLTICPSNYIEVSSELCEETIINPVTLSCPSGTTYDGDRDTCV